MKRKKLAEKKGDKVVENKMWKKERETERERERENRKREERERNRKEISH